MPTTTLDVVRPNTLRIALEMGREIRDPIYSEIGPNRVRLELGSADVVMVLEGDRTIVAETLRAAHRLLTGHRPSDDDEALVTISAAARWLAEVSQRDPSDFNVDRGAHHVGALLNVIRLRP